MTQILTKVMWLPSEADTMIQHAYIRAQLGIYGWEVLERLAISAAEIRKRAYAPNSGYKVGCLIMTNLGVEHAGVNVERIGQSETNHAEELAASNAAMSMRDGESIELVVISHSGKGPPCGRCRQILMQHCDNALIVVADENGRIQLITTLLLLLPLPFKALE